MAFDKETRTITMYQGDYEDFFLRGFDASKEYRIYMSIQNKRRQYIGTIEKNLANVTFVKFEITPELSKLLTVPLNQEYEEYYFAFKVQEKGTNKEKTVRLAGQQIGDRNIIIVYPEEAKGFLSGGAA
jgi:hypothetical protein